MATGKKWSAAQKRKFKATMKAKHAGKVLAAQPTTSKDVLTYLTHAERGILDRVRRGAVKRLTGSDLLTLLALATLRGEV